ncbi:MAG: hypothetical protein JWQ27_74 [Ferruginibacter sp.]|nr:hypothetical protein [Ferruginibacter sp.]
MAETITYTCTSCGKQHEDWPVLVYPAPTNYDLLSQEDKDNFGELDPDFCVIRHPDQTDRFIRCTMTQKVIDHCEDLEYGVWVSLSEKSFQDYSDNFHNDQHEATYFGWLSNDLPGSNFGKAAIPTTVFTRTGNNRPLIVPHESFDHPFVRDYYDGISKTAAEQRIQDILLPGSGNGKRKPWWKLW